MKFKYLLILIFVSGTQFLSGQQLLEVEGNGIFQSESSTRLTVGSMSDTTNALIRFGNDGTSKVSLGYHADDDVLKLSVGNTLNNNSLTMGLGTTNNRFAINSLPSAHRLLIRHNSTSGVDGSSHLLLLENNTTDYARLRFGNEGDDGLWVIAARATNNNSLLNFFYNDGNNFANIMSLDGDLFRVGIHQTEPDAFLHIKQNTAGVDALKFENDDDTGGEIWGFRVGDNDILLYFESDLRGSFNSDDGVYTNFPPSPPSSARAHYPESKVLNQLVRIKPQVYKSTNDGKVQHRLDPNQINEINTDWVVRSEDGERLGISHDQFLALAIQSIREQQELIVEQKMFNEKLKVENDQLKERITVIEKNLAGIIN